MQGQAGKAKHTVPEPTRQSGSPSRRLLLPGLVACAAVQLGQSAHAQDLGAAPLFGSVTLETGFSPSPFTAEVSPGGTDEAWRLDGSCLGYIRLAQPDFVLSYQASQVDAPPLGVFAQSDLDITLAINDPAGNWHCNDDNQYLSGTNSGIQFDSPLSGDYQIWIGSYESGAESVTTLLAITEADASQWASLPIGMESAVYAASFDPRGNIVFGDDSSGFANDGECDDPRFQGPGVAFGSDSSHLFKDASDCRSQYDAGRVQLAAPENMNLGGSMSMDSLAGYSDVSIGNGMSGNAVALTDVGPLGEVVMAFWQAFQAIPGDAASSVPLPFEINAAAEPTYDRTSMTALTGIDFGDNSGPFTDDGECDDPRFFGPGAAATTFEGAELTDAVDCSRLYLEELLTYNESADPGVNDDVSLAVSAPLVSQAPGAPREQEETYTPGVPRGDINGATRADGSIFASGSVYGDPDIPGGRNRNPPRNTADSASTAPPSRGATIDFGDNSSAFANDGECDDPRFEGAGAASVNFDNDLGRDANDCRAAYDAGTVTLIRN